MTTTFFNRILSVRSIGRQAHRQIPYEPRFLRSVPTRQEYLGGNS